MQKSNLGDVDKSWLKVNLSFLGPKHTDRVINFVQPSVKALREKIGDTTTVEFRVGATGQSGRVCFLNSLISFRDADCFTVVIASDRIEQLEKMQIKDWKSFLIGRRLRCHGKVTTHNLGLQMVIEKPLEQLELLDDVTK